MEGSGGLMASAVGLHELEAFHAILGILRLRPLIPCQSTSVLVEADEPPSVGH